VSQTKQPHPIASATSLLAEFPAFATARAEAAPLAALRREAAARFAALGLPGRDREEWKYADLRPFAAAGWRPFAEQPAAPPAALADALAALPDLGGLRLVLVDGVYAPGLSRAGALPAGLAVSPLTAADPARLVAAGFGRLASPADAAFTALSAAWWQGGLFLAIAPEATLAAPIEIVHLATGAAAGRMLAPRLLVDAGRASSAVVVERFLSADGAAHFTNAVGELSLGEGAALAHQKILAENAAAWHIGAAHVRQAARSRYVSNEFVFGGAMSRRELHLTLAGRAASCELNALYLGAGEQRLDLRTRVRHAEADCQTREDGLIIVAQDAQKTDARQTNRNLLLSPDATAYSMPRLEIYADDVKCTHGSTTGQISDEQLFYLRTRGFAAEAARALLTVAFAREILAGIELAPLRQELTGALLARLPLPASARLEVEP